MKQPLRNKGSKCDRRVGIWSTGFTGVLSFFACVLLSKKTKRLPVKVNAALKLQKAHEERIGRRLETVDDVCEHLAELCRSLGLLIHITKQVGDHRIEYKAGVSWEVLLERTNFTFILETDKFMFVHSYESLQYHGCTKSCPKCGKRMSQNCRGSHIRRCGLDNVASISTRPPRIFRPVMNIVEQLERFRFKTDGLAKMSIADYGALDIETIATQPDNDGWAHKTVCIGFSTTMSTHPYRAFLLSDYADTAAMMKAFVTYAVDASKALKEKILRAIHSEYIAPIEQKKELFERLGKESLAKHMQRLIYGIISDISRLKVFTFNGQNYDLPVMCREGLLYFMRELDGPVSTVKPKPQSYAIVTSTHLKLLDILNFTPGRSSLSKALFDFKLVKRRLPIDQLTRDNVMSCGYKFTFPYEALTCVEDLLSTQPFTEEEFYSKLHNANLLTSDWEKYTHDIEVLQRAESDVLRSLHAVEPPQTPSDLLDTLNHILKTMCSNRGDFLSLYCATDVLNTIDLVRLVFSAFDQADIPMSLYNTLPAASKAYMLKHLYASEAPSNFFVELGVELHNRVRAKMVGGIATTFNKVYIAGHTPHGAHIIPPENAPRCEVIRSYDFASLYGFAMERTLNAFGPFVRRISSENFAPTKMMHMNLWELWVCNFWAHIVTKDDPSRYEVWTATTRRGQRYIVDDATGKKHFLDCFIDDRRTGHTLSILAHGCLYHAHECLFPNDGDVVPKLERSAGDIRHTTRLYEDFVRKHVSVLVVLRECQLKRFFAQHPQYSRTFESMHPFPVKDLHTMSHTEMFNSVLAGRTAGLFFVDIKIPTHAQMKWRQFPPIICHGEVSADELSPLQQGVCDSEGRARQSKFKAVFCRFSANDILINDNLIRFYNSIGASITIHEVIQFQTAVKPPMQSWARSLCDGRYHAKLAKNDLLANAFKSLFTSAYGKTLENVQNFGRVSLVEIDNVRRASRTRISKLVSIFPAGPPSCPGALVEVNGIPTSNDNRQTFVQYGVQILLNSKYFMLSVLVHFHVEYFLPFTAEILGCDTDSLIVSYSSKNIHEILIPERKQEAMDFYNKWFVNACGTLTDDLKRRMLTPGIVKLEIDDGKIGLFLAPKMYIIVCDHQLKTALKGIKLSNARAREATTVGNMLLQLFSDEHFLEVPNNRFCRSSVTGLTYTRTGVKKGMSRLNYKSYFMCPVHCCPLDMENRSDVYVTDCGVTYESCVAAMATVIRDCSIMIQEQCGIHVAE